MNPKEILKRPYSRALVPDPDGRFTAQILEFENCVAYGNTQEEALRNLEEVATDWILASIEQGQTIPEPSDNRNLRRMLHEDWVWGRR